MIGVSVIHSEEQLQDNLCKIKMLQVLRPGSRDISRGFWKYYFIEISVGRLKYTFMI